MKKKARRATAPLTSKEVASVRRLVREAEEYPDEGLPARPVRASLKPGEPGSWAEAMKQWDEKQKGYGET